MVYIKRIIFVAHKAKLDKRFKLALLGYIHLHPV